MSQRQTIDAAHRVAPYWADRLARIAANAELLERAGVNLAKLLRRFTDPGPYYGDPVSNLQARDGRLIGPFSEAETTRDRLARERSEARFQETRDRLAERFGLAGGVREFVTPDGEVLT